MASAVCQRPVDNGLHQLPEELLSRFGVRRLNRYDLFLECFHCRATWAPRLKRDGTLPRGYWECPNRCNW